MTKIDRGIAKEPKYLNQPRHALLAFGPGAEKRAWLVMDGEDVLYVDRNGNAAKKVNVAPGAASSSARSWQESALANPPWAW
ncbi:MAG: hypothetical protein L6Q95_00640 [Planctomycetes bacterium]|nr:hypothetical protein [Planctomycetota bacterium]